MKKGDKNSKGFTIIEVALVLAIGGLIFLMVFIALPGLRASQRDAERRENVMTFIQGVKSYQSNNRGSLPANSAGWDKLKQNYFKGKIDPDGSEYKLVVRSCSTKNVGAECADNSTNKVLQTIKSSKFPNEYTLIVVTQATCEGDLSVGTNNPRKVAVLYKLEGAGVFCANT